MDLPKLQLPSELSQAAAQAVAGEVSGCSLLLKVSAMPARKTGSPFILRKKRRSNIQFINLGKQYEKVCLPRLRLCLRR